MNKRIQELAVAAAPANSSIPHSEWNIPKEFIEKFAELLVKECCTVLAKCKEEPFPFDEDYACRLLKNHFGAE